ncbi:MAG: HEAT repeat domain-containing protein [Ruminiclostridium sp.]|nr:HEAT repeat domain-containing protein [Ruminiclostridium sp.]
MAITLKNIEQWESKKNAKKLIRALSNDKIEIRNRATRALSAIDDPEIINYLVHQLRDENSEIRLTSVETLGIIGSGRVVEFIRALIEKETDAKIIDAAKISLAQIREKVNKIEKTV